MPYAAVFLLDCLHVDSLELRRDFQREVWGETLHDKRCHWSFVLDLLKPRKFQELNENKEQVMSTGMLYTVCHSVCSGYLCPCTPFVHTHIIRRGCCSVSLFSLGFPRTSISERAAVDAHVFYSVVNQFFSFCTPWGVGSCFCKRMDLSTYSPMLPKKMFNTWKVLLRFAFYSYLCCYVRHGRGYKPMTLSRTAFTIP